MSNLVALERRKHPQDLDNPAHQIHLAGPAILDRLELLLTHYVLVNQEHLVGRLDQLDLDLLVVLHERHLKQRSYKLIKLKTNSLVFLLCHLACQDFL